LAQNATYPEDFWHAPKIFDRFTIMGMELVAQALGKLFISPVDKE
jgi:hypothetical protein